MARRLIAMFAACLAGVVWTLLIGGAPAGAVGARSAGCTALNGQSLSARVIDVNPHAFKQNERVDLQVSGPAADGVVVAVNGSVVASSNTLPATFSYYIPADGTYRFHLADTAGQITTWHSNCYPGPYATLLSVQRDVPTPEAGQPITFTVNVSGSVPGFPPTGSVSFFVDGATTPAAVVPLVDQNASFVRTFTTIGDHRVQAAYGGDVYNLPSSDIAFITLGESVTSTTLGATPVVAQFGQPITLSGTVTAAATGTPTGNVMILNRGTPIATVALVNGSYTTTVSTTVPGTYTLHAVYLGDATNAPSLSPNQMVTVLAVG